MSGNLSDKPNRAGDPKRLLVAEGNGFTRLGLILITRASGLSVDFASNGTLALKRIRTRTPDALLVEMNLRGLSGLELIKKARYETQFGDRPIYVFTRADALSRTERKELRANGVRLFDKRSVGMEDVIAYIRSELIPPIPNEPAAAAPVQPEADQPITIQNPNALEPVHAAILPAEEPEPFSAREAAPAADLETLVAEVCNQSEQLLASSESGGRTEACRELLRRVSALWTAAEGTGSRNLARQAKVLQGFLKRLCEMQSNVADAAMATVTRSVELVQLLTSGDTDQDELTRFKAVVIDEAPESAETLRQELVNAGFHPICFHQPQDAVSHLELCPADVVIANLTFPDLHGLDLARIRQFPLHAQTPVIYASETTAMGNVTEFQTTKAPRANTTPLLAEELLIKALNEAQASQLPQAAVPPMAAASSSSTQTESPGIPRLSPEAENFMLIPVPSQNPTSAAAPLETAPKTFAQPAQPDAQAADAADQDALAAAAVSAGHRTILFIEDDPFALRLYKKALKRAGYHVEVADDGQVALDLLPRLLPNLVVLDLMLPKVNGLQVLEFMRAHEDLRDTPVLVLSNGFMDYLAVRAKEVGANRGLSKSECTPAILVEQVTELLNLHDTVKGAPLPELMEPDQTGDDQETAIWTRQAGLRKDAPRIVAKIRQACLAYIKCTEPDQRQRLLTDLYRRVRFLSAHTALIGFTKIAEVSSTLEGLLFEILGNKTEPSSSTYQTIAQVVDFIDQLVQKDDTSFVEPRLRPKLMVINEAAGTKQWFVDSLQRGKFDVVGLDDPFEALRQLKDGCFDLVLLEAESARLDGFTLCEQIRRMPQHENIPVIFVAIGTGVTNRARTIISGGNDLITHQLSPMEIVVKVTMHLLKEREARPPKEIKPAASVTWVAEETRANPDEAQPAALAAAEPVELAAEVPPASERSNALVVDEPILPAHELENSTRLEPELPVENSLEHQRITVPEETVTRELVPVNAEQEEAAVPAIAESTDTAADALADSASTTMDETGTAKAEMDPVKAEIAKQREVLAKYERERESLMNRIVTAENEFHRIQNRLERRDEKIQKLQEQLDKLSTTAPAGESAASASESLQQAQSARQEAEARCAELDQTLVALRTEHEQLLGAYNEARQAETRAGERIKELESQLATETDALKRANLDLENQIKQRAEAEQALRAQLENAEAACKRMEAAQAETKAWCAELEQEVATLTKAQDDLKAQVAQGEQARADQGKQLENAEKQLSQRAAELAAARNDLEQRAQAEQSLRAELARAGDAAHDLKTAQQEAEARAAKMEQEAVALRQAQEKLNAQLTQGQRETGKQIQDLEQQLGRRSQELEKASTELAASARSEKELRAQLEKAKADAAERDAGKKQAQEWSAELEKELATVCRDRDELKAQIAAQQELHTETGSRIRDLQAGLSQRDQKLQTAQAELEKRAQSEKELRAQLESALTKGNESQSAHKQAEARAAELEQETKALRQAQEKLNAQLTQGQRETGKQIHDIEQQLGQRGQELENAKTELEARVRSEKELRTQLEKASAAAAAAETAGKQMQARNAELEKETASLRQAQETLNARLTQGQRETGKQIQDLEQQLGQRAQELQKANTELEARVRSEKELRTQLEKATAAAAATSKQAQARNAELEKEVASLRQAREQLATTLDQEQRTGASAAKQAAELEQRLNRRAMEQERQNADWQKQLGQLRQERDEANAQVAAEQRSAAELAGRIRDLDNRLNQRGGEFDQTKAELEKRLQQQAQTEADLRKQLDAAAKAAKETTASEQSLQARCSGLEKELADLRQARESLANQFTKEHQVNVETGNRVKELEQQLKAGTEELARAKAEREKFAQDRARTEADLRKQLEAATKAAKETTASEQSLQARCSGLEKELADLRQARESLVNQFTKEQQVNVETCNRVKELEQQLKAGTEELARLNAERDKQAKDFAQAESALRVQLAETTALASRSTTTEKELQARCTGLEKQLSDLRHTREQLSAQLNDEHQDNLQSARRIKELERQLEDSQHELDAARIQWEKQAEERANTESVLRAQLEAAGNAARQSTETGKELQARCAGLEKQLADLREAREQLQRQFGQEQQAHARTGNRVKELDQQLNVRTQELAAARAESDQRARQHAQAESELRAQLTASGAAAQQTAAAEKELKARCEGLEKQLVDLRQAREHVVGQFHQEQAAHAQTGKQLAAVERQLKESAAEGAQLKTELQQQAQQRAEAEKALRAQLDTAAATAKEREAEIAKLRDSRAALETELGALRDSQQQLNTRYTQEQQLSAESGERIKQLEKSLAERGQELDQIRQRLDAQSKVAVQLEADLRTRLEAARTAADQSEAALQQAHQRCGELEQRLAGLGQERQRLGEQLDRELRASAQAGSLAKELEQRLHESSAELARTRAELDTKVREHARVQSELQAQISAAQAAHQLALGQTSRLEQDVAAARNEQDQLAGKLLKEQQTAAEARVQIKELERQLQKAETEHRTRAAEFEQQISQGVAALARATADLAAERGERERSEQRVATLNQRLQELHEETRRILESERAHRRRIGELELEMRQQQDRLDAQTADLQQQRAERCLAEERLEKSQALNGQLRKNLSLVEGANRDLNSAQQDLQGRLEASLLALREAEAGMRRENVQAQGLSLALDNTRHELNEQTRKRDALEKELQATVRSLQDREALLQQATTERQRLSEELGAVRQELRDRSEHSDLELKKLQQAWQSEHLERKRQETQIVRMRHTLLESVRGARSLRNSLRRQVREPIDNLYTTANRFLQLELPPEPRKVAQALLQDVLLVRARLQQPEVPSTAPNPGTSSPAEQTAG